MVTIDEDEYFAHYGTPRHSGRYPWGSSGWGDGEDDDSGLPRSAAFLDYIRDLFSKGFSEKEVADGLGITTTQLRAQKSIAKNEQKQAQIGMAQRLKDKGYSNVAIGERMGLNESSVRALLAPGVKDRADVLTSTSNMLKAEVDKKKYLDIGAGVENYVGVSKERLSTAVAMLQEQGYEKHTVKVQQIGTGLETEFKVLVPPGVTQKDVFMNRGEIKQIGTFSDDGGRTFAKEHDPIPISPDRVSVKYAEDGGAEADGVIYVRPGVEDLSLGKSRYAQVRIQVGDDHYLKGMAVYKNDLPEGTDLLFNTNKGATENKLDVLKKLERNEDGTVNKELPFGSVTRPLVENLGGPDERVVSSMNLVNEEGDWTQWSKNLSSQFLSKQSPSLAKSQLDMTYERRKSEFDEIMALTNPTVRKKLLENFADETDSAAVHLKAAALPRSNWRVLLPVDSLSPSQVYAPDYNDGDRVVLIRYPHGGTFEIPELTVNNKHAESRGLLGDARDAIGIHHSVAERLSGADFDGDAVLVIPNNSGKVKTSPALEALKDFDPRSSYPAYEGMKPMTARTKGIEMGDVSNLITDMTIKGASHNEIARAVRHSMVVIDAEKHNLDYKRSARENGIASLKEEYQNSSRGGASTLLSRKKTRVRVPERKPRPQSEGGPVDRETGRRVFVETGKTRTTRDGERVPKTQWVNKLSDTSDANTMSSGTRVERIYADHSNKLKNLSNESRLAALNTPPLKYSPSAKKAYASEVSSLNSKLTLAQMNAPRERQAQVLANNAVHAKRGANPNLDGDSLKKIKYQELERARARTGAQKQRVKITEKEWDAIQAGAVSNKKLSDILDNTDVDEVRKLATPRTEQLMTNAKTSRAQSMMSSGHTRAQIAQALGVSLSTLDRALYE